MRSEKHNVSLQSCDTLDTEAGFLEEPKKKQRSNSSKKFFQRKERHKDNNGISESKRKYSDDGVVIGRFQENNGGERIRMSGSGSGFEEDVGERIRMSRSGLGFQEDNDGEQLRMLGSGFEENNGGERIRMSRSGSGFQEDNGDEGVRISGSGSGLQEDNGGETFEISGSGFEENNHTERITHSLEEPVSRVPNGIYCCTSVSACCQNFPPETFLEGGGDESHDALLSVEREAITDVKKEEEEVEEVEEEELLEEVKNCEEYNLQIVSQV